MPDQRALIRCRTGPVPPRPIACVLTIYGPNPTEVSQ